MITESVILFFDWKIRICLKTFRFNQMGSHAGGDGREANESPRSEKANFSAMS